MRAWRSPELRRILELLFHGGYIVQRHRRTSSPIRGRPPCSSTPCPATRSSARRPWRRSTAAGGGSCPSWGSSSCCPRRSSCCAAAGQIVEDENRVRFDPEFDPRAGRQGAQRVRAPGAQPGQHRPHRRRPHGVRAGVRVPVHPRGRRAPRRQDGRLREPRAAVAVVPPARLARRHDLRARGPAARLAPSRHGLRAADAVRQALHGLGDLGPERRRHDRDGRDPVRRPRGDRARAGVDLADQRQLARCATTTGCWRRWSST